MFFVATRIIMIVFSLTKKSFFLTFWQHLIMNLRFIKRLITNHFGEIWFHVPSESFQSFQRSPLKSSAPRPPHSPPPQAIINDRSLYKPEYNLQLFRERLSEKGVHLTIQKGIVGAWFWVHRSSEYLEEWHERSRPGRIFAIVIKKSNKKRFDSTATVVRNIVLIISILPSTFQDCRVYIFSDNLSRNSCIQCGTLVLVSRESPELRY